MTLSIFIETCLAGKNLSVVEASKALDVIMTGQASDVQIAALLVALRAKGETAEEIQGFAETMREHSVKITIDDKNAIDLCGTGGDGTGTFNISTTAAFIAAGAGVTVAKHGNRSVSSMSGSADVLRSLGVNIECSAMRTGECLNSIGIGFLFAPLYHPAMKHAAKARSELGTRSIFNILGPITNPARVKYQVVGAHDKIVAEKILLTLKNLGAERAVTLHAQDGADEVTLSGSTNLFEHSTGKGISSYEVSAHSFGLPPAPRGVLSGGTASENAKILTSILGGEHGPRRDAAVANAALGIYVAGKAATLIEARVRAEEAIDSSAAMKKLDQLREYTNRP
ncbi:MAG TPA: anthranilate phosphoribosyltransferase [Bacteroidetes bacterium]|nr:anthranilate phosphoribosyltransferase [Bacteroidota bacterium]